MIRAVIAGGGPAGAAAAALIASGGTPVTLVEREPEPGDKVCGEFIGADGLASLALLGLDVARLGAHPIGQVRLVRGTRQVEAALPFACVGLSRRALDTALLRKAEASGATLLRGRTLRLVRSGHEHGFAVDGEGDMQADALLLATGKHDVRGARRETAHPPDALVGFKTHLDLAPSQVRALGGFIELMLFPDAYAGLQLIEGGAANLCLVVDRARLARAGGTWDALLSDLCRESAHLARRLEGARAWPKPLAIARIPYGYVYAPREADEPVFRLGDQMGVIPSFVGDGIAIALHTARLAADCVLAGRPAADYHRRARADLARPIRLAWTFHRAGRIGVIQAAMMQVARFWPGGVQHLAAMTRVA